MESTDKTLEIKRFLEGEPDVLIAILFGSVADGTAAVESDLDLGIAAQEIIPSDRRIELIEKLVSLTGRPVDLIDLKNASPVIRTQILTKGKILVKKDTPTYAELIRSMIYDNTDVMPYYNRILKERRERFISG